MDRKNIIKGVALLLLAVLSAATLYDPISGTTDITAPVFIGLLGIAVIFTQSDTNETESNQKKNTRRKKYHEKNI